MLLLNFTHPLIPDHIARIEEITGESIEVLDFMPHFDGDKPFTDQVHLLVENIGLPSLDWQTKPILINPPGFGPIAVTLLAELHGRMGYFPATIRIRPVPESTPPRYEVAEIINLQAVRDAARAQR